MANAARPAPEMAVAIGSLRMKNPVTTGSAPSRPRWLMADLSRLGRSR